MSDLEKRLKSLRLQAPCESFDERIFAVLQGESSDTHRLDQTKGETEQTAGMFAGRPRPSESRHGAVFSGWIAGCVAMLIGAVVGNSLPSISPFRTGDFAASRYSGFESLSARPSSDGESSEQRMAAKDEPDQSGRQQEMEINLAGQQSPGSQNVEKNWISPIAAAVAWEQQTGQIFNVHNHVSDRRFDMCRDCHRVGG